MEQNEFTGKNVEEAIANACQALNASSDCLDIQVVAPGSPGFLGLLRKKAVIRVSRKQDTPASAPAAEERREKRPTKGRPPRNPPKAATPEVLAEIKRVTERVLSLMGYPATAELTQNNGKVEVQISGDHIEAIIGPEGSNLDALQYLVRKMVSQKFSDKVMLTMDANDFRETRKKELRELALEIGRLVKEGRKSKIIAPLNPAERRIIHVTLQNDKAIRSKSIGDGLFKKIKVYIPGQGRSRSNRKRPAHRSTSPRENKEK